MLLRSALADMSMGAKLFWVTLFYLAAALGGLLLTRVAGGTPALWPAAGMGLAALLIFGYRLWPAVTLAAGGAAMISLGGLGLPLTEQIYFSAGLAAGSTLEALLGTWLVKMVSRVGNPFLDTRGVFAFLALAALLSTCIGSIPRAGIYGSAGMPDWQSLPSILGPWWRAAALGTLVVTPFLLSWTQSPQRIHRAGKSVEFILLLAALAFAAWAAFTPDPTPAAVRFAWACMAFPLLLWAAFRFDPKGTSTGILLFISIALWGTLSGHGVFSVLPLPQSILLLQGFIAVLALTTFATVALLVERQSAEQALRQAHGLLELQYNERTAALQQSEQKYRNIFTNAQVGLFRTSVRDGKVLEANDRLAQMFGFGERDEVVGKLSTNDLYVDQEDREQLLRRLRLQGEVSNFEADFRRRDGSIIRLRYSTRLHEEGGYLEGVAVDITDLRLAEEALRQVNENLEARVVARTEELRTANRALKQEMAERQRASAELLQQQQQLVQADKMASLGTLVAGMAHEINNPNGVILMNLPILKEVCKDSEAILEEHFRRHGEFRLGGLPYTSLKDRLPDLIAMMEKSARRIRRLVVDLKDFSRTSEPGRRGPVDVNRVVEDALRLTGDTLRKSTRRSTVSLAEGLPPVQGDPQRLEQVVINLILNACQALTSNAEGIFIATRFADGQVVLKIRDEGRGIPEQDLSRLTDPFFTTRRDQGGSGLGLSVSAGIVKEHGGTLHFDSRIGIGTTVTLALPRAAEEESPQGDRS